jgi:hypothetical protein
VSEQALKGPAAEEALRNYFLSIGYFVVRGCKLRYSRFDVTDVDLFLYGKSSALSRERLNVDVKNKKTPQALERILWVKGLQTVLGFEASVVATTDTRVDVRSFGLEHGVKVLDGAFLGRLTRSGRTHQERITEEKLFEEIDRDSLGKLGGDWRGRYEASKSRLLDSLSFDGCNAWLEDAFFFLKEGIHLQSSCVWRLAYFNIACFLIGVDFVLREHVAADHEQRRKFLDGGCRYGSAGRAYMEKVGKLASALVASVQPGLGDTVHRALAEQAEGVRAKVLAEHISKSQVASTLFDLAKEFESLAFSSQVQTPASLTTSAQGFLALIADFHGFDRKLVLI